jgi:hypothetical protein
MLYYVVVGFALLYPIVAIVLWMAVDSHNGA